MHSTWIFAWTEPQRPLEATKNQDFQFFFKFFSIPFFSKKNLCIGATGEGFKTTWDGISKYSCRSGRIFIDLEMTFKTWFLSGWGFPRQYLPTFQTPITMALGGTVKLVVSTKERRWRVSAILSVRKKKFGVGLPILFMSTSFFQDHNASQI